jgi:arylsulfatase A-like enzyme
LIEILSTGAIGMHLRLHSIVIGCVALAQTLLLVCGNAADAATKQPNIVFFLIDDLGRTDVGFMGCKDIRTPQIDKLAQGGAILDAHYVQPVCSPTRAALLTGRYATRTGVYAVVRPHAKWGLPLEERTLADALRDAGYQTAIVGKWHLGEFDPAYTPTKRGFDHQYGHYFGALDYFTHIRDGVDDWYRDGKPLKEEGYATHLLAKEACRLITERDPKKPLFLYVPFNGVHAPLQVPDSYTEPYANIPGNRRKMAGMLAAVDEAIGQIVATLDKAGLREETLIIFSADNGGPNPVNLSTNGEYRAGKGTLYEGGVRVCAFANWPGKIAAGTTIKEPMHAVDWYPTLVNQAGVSLDKDPQQKLHVDGRDVWPMLTAGAKSPHDAILLVQNRQRAALRAGDWKLVWFAGPDNGDAEPPGTKKKNKKKVAPAGEAVELYNLAEDPSEKNNLAEAQPERTKELRVKLSALLKDAVPEGHLGKQ